MANTAPTPPEDRPRGTPMAAKGDNADIRESLILTANYVASEVVDASHCGSVALQFFYNADGSSTQNQMKFLVFVSNAASEPVPGDDQWSALSQLDATPADAVLTDAMPAGVDVTITPAWGERVIRQSSYSTIAMTTGVDKQRFSMIVDVRRWKFLYVSAKEEGDTTNLGVLRIAAALQT